jgi:hypothetical protein
MGPEPLGRRHHDEVPATLFQHLLRRSAAVRQTTVDPSAGGGARIFLVA